MYRVALNHERTFCIRDNLPHNYYYLGGATGTAAPPPPTQGPTKPATPDRGENNQIGNGGSAKGKHQTCQKKIFHDFNTEGTQWTHCHVHLNNIFSIACECSLYINL